MPFLRRKPRLGAETLVAKISEDGVFTDFTVESGDGTQFSCHKNVLAAQSSVLKGMFLSPIDMRKISYLQLQYKPGIVWKFVKFFYERKIELEEKGENLGSFLEMAEKYDLPHLK